MMTSMLTAIVLIDSDASRIPEVAAAIADIPGVSEVYSVTGEVDLIAMVRVREHDDLADVIADKVSKIEGVVRDARPTSRSARTRSTTWRQAFALGLELTGAALRGPSADGRVQRVRPRWRGPSRSSTSAAAPGPARPAAAQPPGDWSTSAVAAVDGGGSPSAAPRPRRCAAAALSTTVSRTGAGLAGEQPPGDVGVVVRLRAAQSAQVDPRDAEVRAQSTTDSVTPPSRTSQIRVGPVGAISSSPSSPRNTRALEPPPGQHAGHERGHPGVGDADGARARLRRVGERAEEVEGGADAQLGAGGGGVPERRVEHLREAERDPDLGGQLGDAGRRVVEPDPELLEHVGGAGRRRGRPVAVLDHGDPGAGDDQGRHGRDVHGVRRGRRPCRRCRACGRAPRCGTAWLEHRVREGRELGDRLALGLEADEERRRPWASTPRRS